jgi:hypothetical protein
MEHMTEFDTNTLQYLALFQTLEKHGHCAKRAVRRVWLADTQSVQAAISQTAAEKTQKQAAIACVFTHFPQHKFGGSV